VDAGWTSARMPAKSHGDTVSRPRGRRSRRLVDARWTSMSETLATSSVRRLISRDFAKPSDGLEPSTPSLPWNVSGNRWQPTATVFAYLSRFRLTSICHGLPPVAPAGLHKGSILRWLLWLRSSESLARGRCCGKEVVLPLQALEAVPTP
jgi:hypothetical protein